MNSSRMTGRPAAAGRWLSPRALYWHCWDGPGVSHGWEKPEWVEVPQRPYPPEQHPAVAPAGAPAETGHSGLLPLSPHLHLGGDSQGSPLHTGGHTGQRGTDRLRGGSWAPPSPRALPCSWQCPPSALPLPPTCPQADQHHISRPHHPHQLCPRVPLALWLAAACREADIGPQHLQPPPAPGKSRGHRGSCAPRSGHNGDMPLALATSQGPSSSSSSPGQCPEEGDSDQERGT